MKSGPELWSAIDAFVGGLLLPSDPLLDAALDACEKAGLPPIQVTPCQGKFLQLMAQLLAARKILEIGTLGGYSTIWLARALPEDGRLITLELDPKHADVARANFERASVSNLIELRVDAAIESLPKLHSERCGPFDLIFIDADKQGTPEYFRWAMKLARPGTLIIVDNVIRKGALIETGSSDTAVQGMRRFLELLRVETDVTSTVIQTVGSKGYDGFALALVR